MPDPSQISCLPPAAGGNPYQFSNFLSSTLAQETTGDQVVSVYPNCVRLPGASFTFTGNAGLVGMSLASSLINVHVGDVCAMILAIDRGPSFNLRGATNVLALHQSNQNSSAGTANASCRGTQLDLGQNSFLAMSAGQVLSLYACSANDAGNFLSGTAIFWYIPL